MFKVIVAALALVAALLEPVTAQAITVSGTVRYWNSRGFRSDNTGSKVTQSSYQTNMLSVHPLIFLMDMDGACIDYKPPCTETDDDQLATGIHTSFSGTYSFTTGTGHDIYLLHYFYHGPMHSVVRDSAGDPPYIVSEPVAFNQVTDLTRNFNVTCPDDTKNTTQGFCDNQADVTTFFATNEQFANIMAAMVDTEIRIGGGFASIITGYWPDSPGGDCAGTAGSQFSPTEFCVVDGTNNHTVAHEIGHAIHVNLLGGVNLGGTCTATSPWLDVEASEKCVTKEGFAHFCSAVVHWGQNAVQPTYRGFLLEGNTTSANGGSALKCVSNATSPHKVRGNVARFFYDLYDSTNVGTDDATNDDETLSFATISAIWSEMPAGTANNQRSETGDNGRNVYDYMAYDSPENFVGERGQNCLNSQANP